MNKEAHAFFSINGTTHLAEFSQEGSPYDYGDWDTTFVLTTPKRVQNTKSLPIAFGKVALSEVELTALNVIGYTRSRTVP